MSGIKPEAPVERFLLFIDRLSAGVGKAFGWCIIIMTLGTCYDVFMRYLFRAPTNWAFDVSYFMYGALFMMAGAYTLSRNGHVRGDVDLPAVAVPGAGGSGPPPFRHLPCPGFYRATNPEIGVTMLLIFILIIMLGFPISFTLVAMGVFFGYYAMGDHIFQLLVQNTFDIMSNDTLVAVPLFLFMGYIVERANIIDRLFYSIQIAARHVPGSDGGRSPRSPAPCSRPRPGSSAPWSP